MGSAEISEYRDRGGGLLAGIDPGDRVEVDVCALLEARWITSTAVRQTSTTIGAAPSHPEILRPGARRGGALIRKRGTDLPILASAAASGIECGAWRHAHQRVHGFPAASITVRRRTLLMAPRAERNVALTAGGLLASFTGLPK
jgi:hypothetical protein